VQFVERHVRSVEELRRGFEALKPREVDAYFFTSDALVTSRAGLIIDAARVKKMPTMFSEFSLVAKGALASYFPVLNGPRAPSVFTECRARIWPERTDIG
jgi:ABC-type uncharacterized transport system substrate-binding protein